MIGGKLALITIRKSHAGFQLGPKSVTLNDLDLPSDQDRNDQGPNWLSISINILVRLFAVITCCKILP